MILEEQEVVFMKCPFCNNETEAPTIIPDYCESCGTIYILSENDIEELRPFIMEEFEVDIRDYFCEETLYDPVLKEVVDEKLATLTGASEHMVRLQYFSPYPKGSFGLIGLV